MKFSLFRAMIIAAVSVFGTYAQADETTFDCDFTFGWDKSGRSVTVKLKLDSEERTVRVVAGGESGPLGKIVDETDEAVLGWMTDDSGTTHIIMLRKRDGFLTFLSSKDDHVNFGRGLCTLSFAG